MFSEKLGNGFGSTFCQILSSASFQKEAIHMGRDYGCSDALSVSQQMSASKKTNSSCSSHSTSELMKWKTRKKLGLVESAACLSEEGRHIDGLHWKAAKVLMSTEMSSVKSAPSSSAPCCFDREISSCPTLIGREDWWGFLHEHAALAAHLFLFNSLLWTDKPKWLVAWLCFPLTFLFVLNRQRDNLSKHTSFILNIAYDSEQLQHVGSSMSRGLGSGQQITHCWW